MFGTVRRGSARYSALQRGFGRFLRKHSARFGKTARYDAVPRGSTRFHALRRATTRYDAVPCATTRFHTVQLSCHWSVACLVSERTFAGFLWRRKAYFSQKFRSSSSIARQHPSAKVLQPPFTTLSAAFSHNPKCQQAKTQFPPTVKRDSL
jgi:hypothetical protein